MNCVSVYSNHMMPFLQDATRGVSSFPPIRDRVVPVLSFCCERCFGVSIWRDAICSCLCGLIRSRFWLGAVGAKPMPVSPCLWNLFALQGPQLFRAHHPPPAGWGGVDRPSLMIFLPHVSVCRVFLFLLLLCCVCITNPEKSFVGQCAEEKTQTNLSVQLCLRRHHLLVCFVYKTRIDVVSELVR